VWSPPHLFGGGLSVRGAELAECSKRFEGRGSAPDQPVLRGIGSVVSTAGYGRSGSGWTGNRMSAVADFVDELAVPPLASGCRRDRPWPMLDEDCAVRCGKCGRLQATRLRAESAKAAALDTAHGARRVACNGCGGVFEPAAHGVVALLACAGCGREVPATAISRTEDSATAPRPTPLSADPHLALELQR
jgi:hypothetical protein